MNHIDKPGAFDPDSFRRKVSDVHTAGPEAATEEQHDGGKTVNVFGKPITIRICGRDTGDALSVVESHDAPGDGPPPHIHHREDETFQILEGEYEFMVGGKTIPAKAGTTLFAP